MKEYQMRKKIRKAKVRENINWVGQRRRSRERKRARKRAEKRESMNGLTADKIDKNRELCIDLGTEKERERWRERER